MSADLSQVAAIMTPLVQKLGGTVTITRAEFAALSLVKTTMFFEEQTNGDVIVELVKGEEEIEKARKRHQEAAAARSKLVVA